MTRHEDEVIPCRTEHKSSFIYSWSFHGQRTSKTRHTMTHGDTTLHRRCCFLNCSERTIMYCAVLNLVSAIRNSHQFTTFQEDGRFRRKNSARKSTIIGCRSLRKTLVWDVSPELVCFVTRAAYAPRSTIRAPRNALLPSLWPLNSANIYPERHRPAL